MKSQLKQVTFTSNLSFFLFSCIVVIQNMYHQFTSKDFPLIVRDNYIRYLVIWVIMFVIVISIILVLSKKQGSILVALYAVATATLMPILINNYGNYTVIGYLIFTLLYYMLDRLFIDQKYKKKVNTATN